VSSAPRLGFDEGLAAGELRFQRCAACDAVIFYPRVMCPGCGGTELAWQVSAGRGVVYSTTTGARRDGAGHDVSLIDLDEGFRMMSTVTGDPANVHIGDRVAVEFAELDGELAPVFRKEETP
jgi:uncharacterized OB-fold protein